MPKTIKREREGSRGRKEGGREREVGGEKREIKREGGKESTEIRAYSQYVRYITY